MKKIGNKGNSLIILIISIVVMLVIVVGAIIFFTRQQKNEDNINNEESTQTEDKNKTDRININKELNSWNGKYTNNDISINLYRYSEDTIMIEIRNYQNALSYLATLESANEISYDDEFFGETISIKIYKTNEGIKIQASSTDDESLLNEMDGVYTKDNFATLGWDGIYNEGKVSIVLAEVEKDMLNIQIKYGNSYYGTYVSDYSSKEILLEKESFGETETIYITKTTSGIKIQASSTDKGSLLNKINGEYEKK